MADATSRHKLWRSRGTCLSLDPVASIRMAVTLLKLSDGHLSLEFATLDIDRVASAIRDRFPLGSKTIYATATAYEFGGCRFVFQNEWDDPCLISGSDAGDRILEALCADLQE